MSPLKELFELAKRNTPGARRERECARIMEGIDKAHEVYMQAEKAKEVVLSMSLSEYAASQRRLPSDYLVMDVSVVSKSANVEYAIAQAYANLYELILRGPYSAIVDLKLVTSSSEPSIFDVKTEKVVAHGIGIKLKTRHTLRENE